MEKMTTDTRIIEPAVLTKTATILAKRFGSAVSICSAIFISRPERRNALIRVTLNDQGNALPKTVIVKQTITEGSDINGHEALERLAKDWAGLECLRDVSLKFPLVPQFYGGSITNRFIVLEDLGDVHASLVDALTGTDKTEGEAALERYTTALGLLHGLAHGNIKHYQSILSKLKPEAMVWQDELDHMLTKIASVLGRFGISLDSAQKNEINNVFKIVKDAGPFTTLIHGDICPDNVFDDPKNGRMRIIDFEWSFVGNALLDGVYMRMCMPTCWCAKAIPDDVIARCELLYRKELIKNMPAAKNDKVYYESYAAACAYWMICHVGYVTEIWDKDSDLSDPKYLNLHPKWRPEDNLRRPRVLYRIEAFIEMAKKHDALPQLLSLAEKVLSELKVLWPETEPLGYYPAFI